MYTRTHLTQSYEVVLLACKIRNHGHFVSHDILVHYLNRIGMLSKMVLSKS